MHDSARFVRPGAELVIGGVASARLPKKQHPEGAADTKGKKWNAPK